MNLRTSDKQGKQKEGMRCLLLLHLWARKGEHRGGPPQTPQTAKPPNQITFLTVEGSKFKIFRGHSRSIFVQLKHFSNFARKHKIIFCAYFWRKVTKVDFWIKLHVPKNMKILLSILRYTKIISHFILRIINFKNFFH